MALTVVGASLLGCGAAPVTSEVAAPAPSASADATRAEGFSAGAWGEFDSRRQGLIVPLPDGRNWRIDDHSSRWLEATHQPTGSTLLVRTWDEIGLIDRHKCEARARQWRALPPGGGAAMEERAIPTLPDYDTHVEVHIDASRPGEPIAAYALAFGGWARGCFAWIYTTTARGGAAEAALGDRLAAMVDGSLARTRRRASPLSPTLGPPGRAR